MKFEPNKIKLTGNEKKKCNEKLVDSHGLINLISVMWLLLKSLVNYVSSFQI